MSKPLYFLFALSLILMTCYADSSNNTYPKLCAPSDCGNGVPILYPFWRRSNTAAREFCGYPEFGLECFEGQPTLTLPTDTYFVTNINYDNHSITLVDVDVVNQPCPRAQHNVTLGNFPLSYIPSDLNISFYFNCSSYFSPVELEPIRCLRNSESKQSYVFVAGNETYGYDWHMHCEEQVVVTVLKNNEIESNGLITGFGSAMNRGFVLDWRRAADCAECESSDGYCGYNQTSKQSMCICRDGSTVAKSCKKGTLVSTC